MGWGWELGLEGVGGVRVGAEGGLGLGSEGLGIGDDRGWGRGVGARGG